MPVKTITVENLHERNAQDLGGLSLKPGQQEEVEVSSTHYHEIRANTALKIHSESDWSDVSQNTRPDESGDVAARREEIQDYQSAVRAANAEKVAAGKAFQNAAYKATQLGINLEDVPHVDSLTGQWTLQDLIRYQANQNAPYEGVVEGGARPQTREGEVLVEGQVANYRPNSPFPKPVQDGEGKPANEGHTRIGIRVNTEGMPVRHKDSPQKAVGSQDEYKAPAPEEEVHSESRPNHGIDLEKPTGNTETHYAIGGHMAVDDQETVFDVYRDNAGVFDRDRGERMAGDRENRPRTSVATGVNLPHDEDDRTHSTDETLAEEPEGHPGAQHEGQHLTATHPESTEQQTRVEDGPDSEDTGDGPEITPAAQKYAEENNVDLTGIKGTGSGGAVLKRDVEKAEQGRKG